MGENLVLLRVFKKTNSFVIFALFDPTRPDSLNLDNVNIIDDSKIKEEEERNEYHKFASG